MYAEQRLRSRSRCVPAQCSTSGQRDVVSPPSRPRIAICCEFAAMHEAATAASRELEVRAMASVSPDGTARAAPPQTRPTHGDRVIHKELRSLVKQIEMAMAANRHANNPFALHITSWQSESDIDVFGQYLQVHSWPVIRHEAALLDVFSSHEVIMLSPDAIEPLLRLEPDKVYCIGGVVDRTVRKGLTLGWATGCGVTVRRLPIQEHAEALGMGMGTSRSPVLNISDVVAALVDFSLSGDWASSLKAAIPERKQRATVQRPKQLRVSNKTPLVPEAKI